MAGDNSASPAFNTAVITQSDSVTVQQTRGILVIIGGLVKVGFADGTTDIYTNLPTGWHPLRINQVFVTGSDSGLEIHGAY